VAGNADLEAVAAANQIATVLAARRVTPNPVWRALGSPTTTQPHPDTTSSLWFAVGQSLVQSSDAESLAAAQAAFGRSREAAALLAPYQRARAASRRAAIANGEALVAFKQGQFARARTLEESALDELAGAGSGSEVSTQRVLVAANLGDVLLRGFADPDTAIGVYRAALDDALTSHTLDELRYLAPRLAAAELKRGNPLGAADVLRPFVVRASRSLGPGESLAEPVVLRARLMLADAYRQAGQARLAAACYWALLRWPERLVPEAARAIAANLRHVHPDFKPRHARVLDRMLADHDTAAIAATRVRAALLAA
jgi:tetratricopeptide (TPR) repeat protein